MDKKMAKGESLYMSYSKYMNTRVMYKNEFEPLNDTYPHPMEFHGKTYPDAFHAYLEWNNEISSDWHALLDVNRVKFQDQEMREALLKAEYKDLYGETGLGRILMMIHDEIMIEGWSGWEDMKCIDEVLDSIVPSQEMREYWKAGNYDRRKLPNLIAGAPVPLEEKEELLQICGCYMLAWEAFQAQLALEGKLKPGEFFLMKDVGYYPDMPEGKNHCIRAFTSWESARKFLEERLALRKRRWSEEALLQWYQWTILEKWVPGKDDRMELSCSHTLFGTDPVYFTDYQSEVSGYIWERDLANGCPDLSSSTYLTLNTPFAVGDCITLDCYPYVPKRDVLVLAVNKNELLDETHLDCLSRENDVWVVTPEWRLTEHVPALSPLYRMASAEPDDILQAVQAFLHGDAARGNQLLDAMEEIEPPNTEGLLALIEKLDKEEPYV